MNRFLTSVCVLLLAAGSVNAQSAQVKNAAKSTFKLTAYDSNGNATSSTCGVFVTADGEAIGSWSAKCLLALNLVLGCCRFLLL